MEIIVDRRYKKKGYTIGILYVNGEYECDTLEDEVRILNKVSDKIYGKTAIPYGRYLIEMDTISPKFSKYEFYSKVCDGRLPRLQDVPFFEGILIHVADGARGADLLQGCIGVGHNKIRGGLLDGKKVFTELYNKMLEAHLRGEEIWIEIV